MHDSRFQVARQELLRTGFAAVHRVRPLRTTGKEVADAAEALAGTDRDANQTAQTPLPQLSNMLTHTKLWNEQAAVVNGTEWLYVFEDDAVFNADALEHVVLKQNFRVTSPNVVQCLMDRIESVLQEPSVPIVPSATSVARRDRAFRQVPMYFLGWSGVRLPRHFSINCTCSSSDSRHACVAHCDKHKELSAPCTCLVLCLASGCLHRPVAP